MEKHSNFNSEAHKLIVKLNEFAWTMLAPNVETNYNTKKNGIITGDNHSVLLANIAVHYSTSYSGLLVSCVRQNFSA